MSNKVIVIVTQLQTQATESNIFSITTLSGKPGSRRI